MEHKSFKIVRSKKIASAFYDLEKDISHSIEKEEFSNKTLKFMKLVRAS